MDPDGAPEYGRIPQACRRYGLSRSGIYRLAGKGLVRLVKVGNATLVDFESVRSYLATCEVAQITTYDRVTDMSPALVSRTVPRNKCRIAHEPDGE